MIRKLIDSVYVEERDDHEGDPVHLLHECDEGEWMHYLALRENEEGPLYWCSSCGKTIENGEAMALRLYEAPY